MVYILSANMRSEFLACPKLIRFEFVNNKPELLVKASTLLLKYITSGVSIQLIFTKLENDCLLYGLKVFDDPAYPGVIWSITEHNNEILALKALSQNQSCNMHLFNEIAVHVASKEASVCFDAAKLLQIVDSSCISKADYSDMHSLVDEAFNQIHLNKDTNAVLISISNSIGWNPMKSYFITNKASSSLLDLFNNDEGGQQEEIIIWLTDNLHPTGAYHSPQISQKGKIRELTDVMLSYENGAFLIESKCLSIFARENLPNRSKLTKNLTSGIKKAISQLKGGIKEIKAGTIITTNKGETINLERTQPVHAIILVPDISIIENHDAYGISIMKDFLEKTGGFLHILDIAELLRVVQAAEMISARGKTTTPMMAFDYYLMERFKKAVESGTLCINILLRFAD